VGVNASKNTYPVYITGLMPSKIYKRVPSARKWSILAKHGACWPCHSEQRCFPNAEELDPGPWHPNYVRLHRWWEILDLGHGNCTSERGEVLLHPSQNSLSLSGWRSPCCCCWSDGYCWLVLPLVEDVAWSSRSLLDALVPHLYITDT
jgi:hypothetical protein